MQNKNIVRNLIRASLLLIVLPVLYLVLWISISGNESLSYAEQVQLLMSYIPEPFRDPFGITFLFFGMSFLSAVFGFYAFLKSGSGKVQLFSIFIAGFAGLLALWYGFTLL